MIKKLFVGFLILSMVFIGGMAHAGQVVWKIIDETLDADPVQVFSDNIYIGNFKKVGFFVVYDETETGGVSGLVDITLNPTATVGDPASGYFWDFGAPPPAGTMVASESLTDDTEYYFWLPEGLTIPYVQVRVLGVGADADDTIDVQVYLIGSD